VAHTEEGILLVGYLVALAIIEYFSVRKQIGTTFAIMKNIGKPFLMTLSILAAGAVTVKTINYFAFGVFATSEMSSRPF